MKTQTARGLTRGVLAAGQHLRYETRVRAAKWMGVAAGLGAALCLLLANCRGDERPACSGTDCSAEAISFGGAAGETNDGTESDAGGGGDGTGGANERDTTSAGFEEASAGNGGPVSSSGEAGAPADSDECSSHAECMDEHGGNPFICKAGRCLALTKGDECPLVLGAGEGFENLRNPRVQVFGMYSTVNQSVPRMTISTLNYELAIEEVNRQLAQSSLEQGPFVAVVCRGNFPNLDVSLPYLFDELELPAVVTGLMLGDMFTTLEAEAGPDGPFLLSPLTSDPALLAYGSDAHAWYLLGPMTEIAPAYVPLLRRTEAFVRRRLEAAGDAGEQPLRVAMVEARQPDLLSIADTVYRNAEFNGTSFDDNERAGQLLRIRTDSAAVSSDPDLGDAASRILEFAPHIVLAISSSEFTSMLQDLETDWSQQVPDQIRPFVLLSPLNYGTRGPNTIPDFELDQRLLGVNFAGAQDTRLYDAYLARLLATYDVPFSLVGSENFYDAAYYMMYSIIAAGGVQSASGADIAAGMQRLVTGTETYDVGPEDVEDVVQALTENHARRLALQGTLGPPDFDVATGTRRTKTSIYCMSPRDQAGTSWDYQPDILRYDPESDTLVGEQTCIAGF